jgi:hypothetical protein
MTKRLPQDLICEQPSQSRDNISIFFLLLIIFNLQKAPGYFELATTCSHICRLPFGIHNEVQRSLLKVMLKIEVRINRLIVNRQKMGAF